MSTKKKRNPISSGVRKNRRYVNGEAVDASNSSRIAVMKGAQKTSKTTGKSTTSDADTTQVAASFLENVNIGVCSGMDQDYSLLNVQTDKETIDNPNISSGVSLGKSGTDKKVKATDKFANSDDPFYEPDGNVPIVALSTQESTQRAISNMKSLKVAVDLINLNESLGYEEQLKQLTSMPK
jgi:hypothetical protein